MADIDEKLKEIEAGLEGVAPGADDDLAPATPAVLASARSALAGFMKTGRLPQAAMSVDSDPDGGYTVDRKLSDTIQRRRLDMSPIGRLARHEMLATGDRFEEPWDTDDIGASWVGERESRPDSTGTSIALMSYPLHEIYTSQPVTQRLLDDSAFNVAAWLEDKIIDKFGRAEGAAFVSGSGVNQPRGILSYDTVANASWTWGKIGHTVTGVAADINDASNNGVDALISTVYSLRAPYRANARWLMNSTVAAKCRKLKSIGDTANYLWTESTQAGQPPTLLGYPVEIDEEMSNVGANAFPIAFGDFRRGYLIAERPGIRLLRDPYTSKPNVLFYAYRRVGGGVQDFDAIKLVKCST